MRPNILWICTDQQRYDTIGALNNPYVHTPNIDKLVEKGVSFNRAYCQSPICTPSRASFLTGMYPASVHGCTNGNANWAEGAPLVTALLADAGYDCGLVGKLHLAGAQGRIEPRPQDDGYRVFEWSHGPQDLWESGHAYADWLREQGHDPAVLLADNKSIPAELHQTSWCADRAIDFIQADHDGKPWLMSVNIFDPHSPFNPPQSHMDHFNIEEMPGPLFRESDLSAQAKLSEVDFQTQVRRPEDFDAKRIQAAYYAMIELIDDNVGRMLAALENSSQLENTIVIFISDHGETLGDHGLLLKGCRFYEGLVRVPMIWSWQGQFPQGIQRNALVELTDIAPTLLDFAGVQIPAKMQGQSLRALLENQSSADQHRDFVRCEYYGALSSLSSHNFAGTYATMLRDEGYKLIVYHGLGVGELFDMVNDPDEFNNLWDDPAMVDIKMRLLIQSFDALAFGVDTGTEQLTRF